MPDQFDQLDRLIADHPPSDGPANFPAHVLRNLTGLRQAIPIWQYPAVQWFATTAGLLFALGRLLGYIFSAWLCVQLAG